MYLNFSTPIKGFKKVKRKRHPRSTLLTPEEGIGYDMPQRGVEALV
jgi:hypothetical protein